MIGVWDTVGSSGIPGLFFELFDEKKYGFLDTALHPCVRRRIMPSRSTSAAGSSSRPCGPTRTAQSA